VFLVPYRKISLFTAEGVAETFRVRISDAAVIAWLAERSWLRAQGFPDRPSDVDTPTHRAWIPRRGEARLPYFADGALPPGREEMAFPVYSATWYSPGAIATKVIVTGLGDGSLASRVVVDHEGGGLTVDQARIYPPDADPDLVWYEIEVVVMAIDLSRMGWEAHSPVAALDAEVELAEREARAAGLLALVPVH
jgi:hypothetical protein